LGWAFKYDPAARNFVDDPEGVKKLARFVFTKAIMVEAPIDALDAPAGEAEQTPIATGGGAPTDGGAPVSPAEVAAKPLKKARTAFLQEDTPLV
jgi:hypothetical protein